MNSTDRRLVLDLIQTWDAHNNSGGKFHDCWFESEWNGAGVDCPVSYPTLGDWLAVHDFPVEKTADRIFGRNLDEPNFRLAPKQPENPVKDKSHPLNRERDRAATHTVLSSRAERAANGPVVNERESEVVVDHQNIEERLRHLEDGQRQILSYLSHVLETLDGLVETVGEQSEPVHNNIVLDMKNLGDNIAQAVTKAIGDREAQQRMRRARR